MLERTDLARGDFGTYSVAVPNTAGSVSASAVVAAKEGLGFGMIKTGPISQILLPLSGENGVGYRVESTTNFVDWSFLFDVTATEGPVPVVLSWETNRNELFFRAIRSN